MGTRTLGSGAALAVGVVALVLGLVLAACDVPGAASPPVYATRTVGPAPALSPLATAAQGTPGAVTTPGAGTPGAGTPGVVTTPDRTSTPAPGSTASPGPGTPTALALGTATPTPGPGTPRPGLTTTPSGASTPSVTAPAGAAGTAGASPTVASGTLQLVSHSGSVQGGEYVVSGTIRNNTNFTPGAVRVAGTLYDQAGGVVSTAEAAVTGDGPFRPGEQRAFSLRFPNDPRIVRYYVDIRVS